MKKLKAAAGKKQPKKKIAAAKVVRKEPEGGPSQWLIPLREGSYTRLAPRGETPVEYAAVREMVRPKAGKKAVVKPFVSLLQEDKGEEVLGDTDHEFWVKRLAQYKRHKSRAVTARAAVAGVAPMPAVPGANSWVPLGPSVVARGQAANRPAVGGRTSGLAIAPGGSRIYAATAVGGVWRSDDSGRSWRSCMDGFDSDPTSFASSSLACGAIAIDPADPNRIYVGTGEGDTDALFNRRLVSALPAYRGIGPIRSDDGGQTWSSEPTAAASPSLAGRAFFALAVDPANREHVVGATTNGLYERVPAGAGFEWVQRRTGGHSSVVVARAGATTRFFAAQWGGGVFTSTNGSTWTSIGTGFPTGIGRVSLGVQRDNPNVLYAYISSLTGTLQSVQRLDGAAGAWKLVSGVPAAVLPAQGDYNLPIAVDPANVNVIYLGGNSKVFAGQYTGAIHRCNVSPSGAAYTATGTYIGANAHSDVHVLVHAPGDSNNLWTGCDGGVFQNTNPTGAGTFLSRNTGLAVLCSNYFSQHPTERAVIFCGLQDNGTARYTGEECWRHVQGGDGGYCVINWADPFKVLVYANGKFYRATDGGLDYGSWTAQVFSWLVMAEPMVSPPYNPGTPAEADLVAVGVDTTIHFSTDFGQSFTAASDVTLSVTSGTVGSIYSMVFASATRLFVGTTTGHVFRLDLAAGAWTATRLDNATLLLAGLVSDIAIDWSDATRSSIYVAFGGNGDFRHVWRFDGTNWTARSGPAAGGATSLLDVEHNAIVVDPDGPANVYVGADIGVWHSSDSGNTWSTLEAGLPDAPVFDLQIHHPSRLLRASLHGRGLYEWKLDAPAQADVELYIRDTMLDTGRGENTDGRNDPSIWPTAPMYHYRSPNIKIDVPTPVGYQTPTNQVDFFEFNEVIVDGSQGVGTIPPPAVVHNRVYVEVHNRGRTDAASVQVMAAITNASAGLGQLPSGYTAKVVAGTPIGGNWTTLGTVTLANLRAGFPQIAAFDLPSNFLPLPASLPGQSHFCLLAFLHSSQDPFTGTQLNADTLTIIDRKVGQKNLHIVEFIGVPPPASSPGSSIWAMLDLAAGSMKKGVITNLVFDASRFPGTLEVALPKELFPTDKTRLKDFRVSSTKPVQRWIAEHRKAAERLFHEGKYSEAAFNQLIKAMDGVAAQPLLKTAGKNGLTVLPGLSMKATDRRTMFLRITPPAGAKIGDAFEFHVEQREAKSGLTVGGSSYSVVINRPAKVG